MKTQCFDYDATLARVERKTIDALAWLSKLGKHAEVLAEDLSRLPDDRMRRQRVRELAHAEPGVVAASLLGVSCRMAHTEPARAGALAELAIVAAEVIDSTDAPSLKSGLLGVAQDLLGRTLRRTQRIKEAEEAFARAASYLSATPDKATLSLYCHLLSRLPRVQGPIGESLARFDRAALLLDASPGLRIEPELHARS